MKVYYINQLNQIELTIDEPFGSNRGGSNRRLEISMGKNKKEDTLMDKVVSLSKRRGFVYPGSEVYGGWPMHGISVPWAWNCSTT